MFLSFTWFILYIKAIQRYTVEKINAFFKAKFNDIIHCTYKYAYHESGFAVVKYAIFWFPVVC